jgi:hypothetical protein
MSENTCFNPKAWATVIREEIKKLAERLKLVNDDIKRWKVTSSLQDKDEMIANWMLSYRHLEDASMRLGKVIQAYDWWVSIYSQSAVDTPKETY